MHGRDDEGGMDSGAVRARDELARFDFSNTTQFGCPILMFEGRHDYTTRSEVVEKWLQRVKPPSKKLVWFENSAHMVMVEEPGKMLVRLVQDALPYAQKRQ
jgi:proline iminopeptidase